MNTQKTILALAIAAVAALPAFGALGTDGPFTGFYPGPTTTTQSLGWPKTPGEPDVATIFISVPQFNTAGGTRTLLSVDVTLFGSVQATMSVHNAGAAPVTGSVSGGGAISLFDPSNAAVTLTTVFPTQTGNFVNLAVNATRNFSPAANTDSASVNVNTGLATWTGAGNVLLPIIGDATTGSGSNGSIDQLSISVVGYASASVTYNYSTVDSQVPEPRVYGAIGAVACLGLLGYRRLRARQAAQA